MGQAGWREARAEAGWVGDKREQWGRLCVYSHGSAGLCLHLIKTRVRLRVKYQL